jgi:hypothetical protein
MELYYVEKVSNASSCILFSYALGTHVSEVKVTAFTTVDSIASMQSRERGLSVSTTRWLQSSNSQHEMSAQNQAVLVSCGYLGDKWPVPCADSLVCGEQPQGFAAPAYQQE